MADDGGHGCFWWVFVIGFGIAFGLLLFAICG
jgi:hypothetical protein